MIVTSNGVAPGLIWKSSSSGERVLALCPEPTTMEMSQLVDIPEIQSRWVVISPLLAEPR